ncbi:mas-related G-protein coupled receptor member F-like isoform X2 [Equus przewalskii]|uniref:Mas-related G-protein coupled receptor member F-like isoform X2 n=1 Tax=Equus przewalskii TaxID=9798 RepID=A0ABM4JX27_EQUPR
MAHEPRNDPTGVSPRPQPWPSHPNNGSELPTAANATAHSTSVDGAHAFSTYQNTLFLATVLVSLCGLVGNGTVIWLLGFRIKRNPFSVYILNLAGADFAFLFCKSVSGVNPLIYFFMGRQRQQRGWKPLREVLQSALTEDVELSTEEPPSPDDT